MATTRPRPLPETDCGTGPVDIVEPAPAAALWLWPGRAVYAGPSLDLDAHSGSVSCLAVGLDAEFTVQRDGAPARAARTALISARQRHRLAAHGRMVFCYLDADSSRHASCAAAMIDRSPAFGWGHRAEPELLESAALLRTREDVERWLDLAAPVTGDEGDERIDEAASLLRAGGAWSADELARAVGLSGSRFLHLFREHTGTSFRRYRLWTRMLRVAESVAEGHDLTSASMGAGFASPSHFSDSFRAMFGLSPTALLSVGASIEVYSGESSSLR